MNRIDNLQRGLVRSSKADAGRQQADARMASKAIDPRQSAALDVRFHACVSPHGSQIFEGNSGINPARDEEPQQ
jgi:hypothetical protein